jgi:stage II sporulation protein D
MFRRRIWGSLWLSLLLITWLGGCSLLRKPEKAPPPPADGGENRVLKMVEAGEEPILRVYIDESGEIKELPMEEYLAGVVAAEMKTDWPKEALAAQAILARTFTLEAIKSKGGVPLHGTDACTNVEHFQAYNAEEINDAVREAVEMTRGKVILYQDEYIKAWFSAYAGEKTAFAKEGLAFKDEEPGYIVSVKNPGAKYAPEDNRKWTASFTQEEFRKALKEMGHDLAEVSQVTIAEKGPTGRAVLIGINDDVKVAGADLRIALGSTELKSILLQDITVSGDEITFQGQGYGHGVGMCQWGAYGLAKEGKSPQEIVEYYFAKDIRIGKFWD